MDVQEEAGEAGLVSQKFPHRFPLLTITLHYALINEHLNFKTCPGQLKATVRLVGTQNLAFILKNQLNYFIVFSVLRRKCVLL